MPGFKYTEEEVPQFTALPKGKYRYQVVGFDVGISAGKKSNGCETMEVKLLFFDDKGVKAAQWTETLILPQTNDQDTNRFLSGLINMFVKSSNLLIDGRPPAKNQDIEFTAETVVGLCGWALVDSRINSNDAGKVAAEQRRYNHVDRWLTDAEKLPKHVETEVAPADDENPF